MRKVIAADIAVSLSENRFTMGLLAIYLAMGMFTAFFRIFSVLFAVTLVMNVMAYNERSGFERFMAAMPVKRSAIVAARYVEMVGLSAMLIIAQYLLSNILPGIARQSAGEIVVLLGTLLVYVSVIMPFITKLGVERSRVVYIVVLAACAALAAVVGVEGGAPESTVGFLGIILPAAGLAGCAVSVPLSLSFYNKREF